MESAKQPKYFTIDDIYNLPEGKRAELIDGKIYYCVADRAAQLGGLIPHSQKSYIDLSNIDKNSLESRKAILELCAGNIEGGSLEFCKMCGGFGCDNTDEVQAAKQAKITD